MKDRLDGLFDEAPTPTARSISTESLDFWLTATVPGLAIAAALISLLPELFFGRTASTPNLRELHHIIGATTSTASHCVSSWQPSSGRG